MSKKRNCGFAILFKSHKCLLRKTVRSCLHRPCFHENMIWLSFMGGIIRAPFFNYQGDGSYETKPCSHTLCWHTMMSHIPRVYWALPLHSTEPTTAPLTWIERLHKVAVPSVPLEQNQSRDETLSVNILTLFCFVFPEIYVPLWGILTEVQGSSAEMTTHAECRVSLNVFVSASWDHTQVFRDQTVTPSVQTTEFSRTETSFSYLGQKSQ